jgi:signal transduction histidine kinase
VQVSLIMGDQQVRLTIEDRGAGFNANATLENGRTMGLSGMRERVDDLGGGLSVKSTPGAGTKLTITIPRQAPRPDEESPGQ